MRILILEHEPEAPAALLGEWAHARGHEYELARVPAITAWPDPGRYGAIVSLGSESSVHAEPHAWVNPELELLRAAHDRDVPILGICFGAQALARALGGHVGRAAQAEVRWGPIETGAPELVTVGPWFIWHEDEFGLPAGARLLAGTAQQTMAFSIRRSLALQFHPEVDLPLASAWIEGGHTKLAEQGIQTSALRAQIEQHADGARKRAFEQFDRIEAWWCASSSLAWTHPVHKETR